MIQQKPVIVKEFPSLLDSGECRRFYRQFRTELAECYRPQLVFDLSAVQNMTAQGVDLLVRCINQIADRDGELKFAAASPETELVLELTQISGIAEHYESVEDALESWTEPARTPMAQPELSPIPQVA
jgi:anti-anti-sigma regulatory factor